jgi:hypothetical protein
VCEGPTRQNKVSRHEEAGRTTHLRRRRAAMAELFFRSIRCASRMSELAEESSANLYGVDAICGSSSGLMIQPIDVMSDSRSVQTHSTCDTARLCRTSRSPICGSEVGVV